MRLRIRPERPFHSPFDDRLLASLADGEVDRRRTGVDAEVLGVGDVAVDGSRLQEGLGRDAPAVQARAAHLPLLDQRHRQPRGRSVQRGGVPAGASADDHEIQLLGRGNHLVRCGVDGPAVRVAPPHDGPFWSGDRRIQAPQCLLTVAAEAEGGRAARRPGSPRRTSSVSGAHGVSETGQADGAAAEASARSLSSPADEQREAGERHGGRSRSGTAAACDGDRGPEGGPVGRLASTDRP